MTKKAGNETKGDVTQEPEELFLEDLKQHGVKHVDEFREELLGLLKREDRQSCKVKDIFKNFGPNSRSYRFLTSMRENRIARPQGGGKWRADTLIRLTREGFDIAKNAGLQTRPIIFISYSHKDTEWKDRIMEHLGVLEHVGMVTIWEDRLIEMGAEWYEEIKDALNRAQAAVLLISSAFINSEFISKKELPNILGRTEAGFRVFPILVRPCAWQIIDWLRRLQIRPEGNLALSSVQPHQIDEHLAKITLEVSELLTHHKEAT